MLKRGLLKAIMTAALVLPFGQALAGPRIKDIVDVENVRSNQLVGYGLVVGLNGTGDSDKVAFTSQSMAGMLGRLGIRVDPKQVITHRVPLEEVGEAYEIFSRKLDNCIKTVLVPPSAQTMH